MGGRLAMCSHSNGANLRLCFYMRDGLEDSVDLVHFPFITGDPHRVANIYGSLLLAWL